MAHAATAYATEVDVGDSATRMWTDESADCAQRLCKVKWLYAAQFLCASLALVSLSGIAVIVKDGTKTDVCMHCVANPDKTSQVEQVTVYFECEKATEWTAAVQFEDPLLLLILTIVFVCLSIVMTLAVLGMLSHRKYLAWACLRRSPIQRTTIAASAVVLCLLMVPALTMGAWAVEGYRQAFKIDLQCNGGTSGQLATPVFSSATDRLHTITTAWAVVFLSSAGAALVFGLGALTEILVKGGFTRLSIDAQALTWYSSPLHRTQAPHKVRYSLRPGSIPKPSFQHADAMNNVVHISDNSNDYTRGASELEDLADYLIGKRFANLIDKSPSFIVNYRVQHSLLPQIALTGGRQPDSQSVAKGAENRLEHTIAYLRRTNTATTDQLRTLDDLLTALKRETLSVGRKGGAPVSGCVQYANGLRQPASQFAV
jgi:hypothetical protein